MIDKKVDLIFKEETYKLRGILFDVHNKLSSVQKEEAYGNALEVVFKKLAIPYAREKEIALDFDGENIGRLYLDFIVWDQIGLELKAKKFLILSNIKNFS